MTHEIELVQLKEYINVLTYGMFQVLGELLDAERKGWKNKLYFLRHAYFILSSYLEMSHRKKGRDKALLIQQTKEQIRPTPVKYWRVQQERTTSVHCTRWVCYHSTNRYSVKTDMERKIE